MNKSVVSTLITVLLWIMTLATAVSIFRFSSENAQKSTETSGKVIRTVAELVVPEYKRMTPAEQDSFVESVTKVVRKFAHFTIFGCLGFWLYFLIGRYRSNLVFPFAVFLSLAYAITDEVHQRFISGRSGQVRDVFIDLAGAAAGAAAALLIKFVWQKLRNKGVKRV